MFDLFLGWRASKIADVASHTALRSSGEAREAKTDVARLADRVDRLELAAAAMWSLLKESHGFNDDQLMQRAIALDDADGKRDGRIAGSTKVCPKCQRPSPVRHSGKCLWCGEPLSSGPFGS